MTPFQCLIDNHMSLFSRDILSDLDIYERKLEQKLKFSRIDEIIDFCKNKGPKHTTCILSTIVQLIMISVHCTGDHISV